MSFSVDKFNDRFDPFVKKLGALPEGRKGTPVQNCEVQTAAKAIAEINTVDITSMTVPEINAFVEKIKKAKQVFEKIRDSGAFDRKIFGISYRFSKTQKMSGEAVNTLDKILTACNIRIGALSSKPASRSPESIKIQRSLAKLKMVFETMKRAGGSFVLDWPGRPIHVNVDECSFRDANGTGLIDYSRQQFKNKDLMFSALWRHLGLPTE